MRGQDVKSSSPRVSPQAFQKLTSPGQPTTLFPAKRRTPDRREVRERCDDPHHIAIPISTSPPYKPWPRTLFSHTHPAPLIGPSSTATTARTARTAKRLRDSLTLCCYRRRASDPTRHGETTREPPTTTPQPYMYTDGYSQDSGEIGVCFINNSLRFFPRGCIYT